MAFQNTPRFFEWGLDSTFIFDSFSRNCQKKALAVLVSVCCVALKLAHNGLQLGEVAEIEDETFNFTQKFN